jgi:hypothetical protein
VQGLDAAGPVKLTHHFGTLALLLSPPLTSPSPYMALLSVAPSDGSAVARDRIGCSGDEQAQVGDERHVEQPRTPLPVRQIFVLCLMRFAEPISFLVVSIIEVCIDLGTSNVVIRARRYSPL